jgi:hypothetical protein
MKSCRRFLIVSVLIGFVFLLPIAPAIAGPGPGAADKDKDDRRPVEFTYTKWITTPLPAPLPWMMEGFVNDGANGSFVGEVFERNVTTNPHITLGITKLEAVYQVIDGDRSFTALHEQHDRRGVARGRHSGRMADRRPGARRIPERCPAAWPRRRASTASKGPFA